MDLQRIRDAADGGDCRGVREEVVQVVDGVVVGCLEGEIAVWQGQSIGEFTSIE